MNQQRPESYDNILIDALQPHFNKLTQMLEEGLRNPSNPEHTKLLSQTLGTLRAVTHKAQYPDLLYTDPTGIVEMQIAYIYGLEQVGIITELDKQILEEMETAVYTSADAVWDVKDYIHKQTEQNNQRQAV